MADSPRIGMIPSDMNDDEVKDLVSMVYNELRFLARKYLDNERIAHTLQPTALVHEAYTRLMELHATAWKDRNHFFAMAAKTMRRVLVDYARKSLADKRGAAQIQITLDEQFHDYGDQALLLEEIDAALKELHTLDPRQCQIVEMRFFAGLSIQECSDLLQVSKRTINTDWQMARAWLFGRLSQKEDP